MNCGIGIRSRKPSRSRPCRSDAQAPALPLARRDMVLRQERHEKCGGAAFGHPGELLRRELARDDQSTQPPGPRTNRRQAPSGKSLRHTPTFTAPANDASGSAPSHHHDTVPTLSASPSAMRLSSRASSNAFMLLTPRDEQGNEALPFPAQFWPGK
jgi:hypothetical protein